MKPEIRNWMAVEKRKKKLEKRYRRRRALLVAGAFGTGFVDLFVTTATVSNGHTFRGIAYLAGGIVLATILGIGAKKAGNKLEGVMRGRE